MKIVFISNIFTPHQIPFCDCMYQICGSNFWFVETTLAGENLPIGWKANSREYPYVIAFDRFEKERTMIRTWIDDADVVLIGSAPDALIIERLKKRKLTFKYSERFYKKRLNFLTFLRAIGGAWLHHGRFQRFPLYMLCASAYTAADCARFNNYTDRCYRWGYFPKLNVYASVEALMDGKDRRLIVWAGRHIDWKHPEVPIEIAKRLKENGIDFHLRLIGSGDMTSELQETVERFGLGENVSLIGSITPEEVRKNMEEAGVFLFTSDFQEGWGAVTNEAMNSGCAVVASHAIGSVPYLIKHGENGLIYKNGDYDDLYLKTEYLLENPSAQKDMGIRALHTIEKLWNGEVAANRFVRLSQEILSGNRYPQLYESGPCSKAEIIKNNWFSTGNTKI